MRATLWRIDLLNEVHCVEGAGEGGECVGLVSHGEKGGLRLDEEARFEAGVDVGECRGLGAAGSCGFQGEGFERFEFGVEFGAADGKRPWAGTIPEGGVDADVSGRKGHVGENEFRLIRAERNDVLNAGDLAATEDVQEVDQVNRIRIHPVRDDVGRGAVFERVRRTFLVLQEDDAWVGCLGEGGLRLQNGLIAAAIESNKDVTAFIAEAFLEGERGQVIEADWFFGEDFPWELRGLQDGGFAGEFTNGDHEQVGLRGLVKVLDGTGDGDVPKFSGERLRAGRSAGIDARNRDVRDRGKRAGVFPGHVTSADNRDGGGHV